MNGILNIQINISQEKPEINRKKVEHFIKKYSDKKPDLVVLPENFCNCDSEALMQETLEFFKEISKKLKERIQIRSNKVPNETTYTLFHLGL